MINRTVLIAACDLAIEAGDRMAITFYEDGRAVSILTRKNGDSEDVDLMVSSVADNKTFNEKTNQFLALCERKRIKRVCIGVASYSVPVSMMLYKAGMSLRNMVMTANVMDGTYQAIWNVAKEFGVFLAGSGRTATLIEGHGLQDGCYHLIRGKWVKTRNGLKREEKTHEG